MMINPVRLLNAERLRMGHPLDRTQIGAQVAKVMTMRGVGIRFGGLKKVIGRKLQSKKSSRMGGGRSRPYLSGLAHSIYTHCKGEMLPIEGSFDDDRGRL